MIDFFKIFICVVLAISIFLLLFSIGIMISQYAFATYGMVVGIITNVIIMSIFISLCILVLSNC